MDFLPGWNSLDATTRWHSVFELVGIAFLALLVATEILVYFYGHHKDTLAQSAAQMVEIEWQNAASVANHKHADEVAALRQQVIAADQRTTEADQRASEAGKRTTVIEASREPRHLTAIQKESIIDEIQPFAGQTVDVIIPKGNMEATSLAEEYVAMFRAAGWHPNLSDAINDGMREPVTDGIQVTINDSDLRIKRLPRGAGQLIDVIVRLGLARWPHLDPHVPTGKIQFRIGPREP